MKDEAWKVIPGTEGICEVSSIGRIRNGSFISTAGHRIKGKVRKVQINKDGHVVVGIIVDGKNAPRLVHRLVAQAFIPNPNNLPCVLHGDDNPSNNQIKNLSWGHQSHVGGVHKGLSVEIAAVAAEVKAQKKSGIGVTKIAENVGISRASVYRIITKNELIEDVGLLINRVESLTAALKLIKSKLNNKRFGVI